MLLLKRISDEYYDSTDVHKVPHFKYEYPELVVRPRREAFHAPSKIVALEDAVGEISAESFDGLSTRYTNSNFLVKLSPKMH